MSEPKPLEILFVLPPNLVLLDFAGPAEAFRIATELGAPFALRIAATGRAGAAASSSMGLALAGVVPLPGDVAPNALVVVCGASRNDVVLESAAGRALIAWLRHVAEVPTRRIACVCSGALFAARAGVLRGRRCTTHHTLIEALTREAPDADVLDSRVFVEDRGVYTSAGITAGIDLALYLIAELASPRIAAAVAREMVVYLRRAPDDPALSPWLAGRDHMDARVHRVQDALSRAPERDWPLAALAAVGHMSQRTLTRRFRAATGVSVRDYHARLRIAVARQALGSGTTVERAAERSGLGSARQLRRVWKAVEGGTPGRG